jgi:stage IV sporulation protein FB
MSDSSSWSLYLGRWWRVPIRAHALFVGAAVFILFLSSSGPDRDGIAIGILVVGTLLASVIAHELGHCFAALRAGAIPDPIVIGPLGGLGHSDPPREPQAELIKALGGPLVNLAVLLVLFPVLLATISWAGVSALLSPLQPTQLTDGVWWLVALKLTFWTNWLILSVNLLPAFPFDAGRVMRSLLWPAMEFRGATQVAVRASKLTALGLCILAWLLNDQKSAAVLPTWVPLLLVAAYVYFAAQHEAARLEDTEWNEELFNYDFSQGYTSLERTLDAPRRPGGTVRRWLETRRELRERRRQSQEQDEERQVDAILVRLHEAGMEGLSAKERALLNRVSARYRNRQRN